MSRLSLLLRALCGIGAFPVESRAEPRLILESRFLHLRNTEAREWSRFPEKPDAERLHLVFDLESPDTFRLLTLRPAETRQPWAVRLNGQALATLRRDHNHLEHGIEIGTLTIPERDVTRPGLKFEQHFTPDELAAKPGDFFAPSPPDQGSRKAGGPSCSPISPPRLILNPLSWESARQCASNRPLRISELRS